MKKIILFSASILLYNLSVAQSISGTGKDSTQIATPKKTNCNSLLKRFYFRMGSYYAFSISHTYTSTSYNGLSETNTVSKPAGHGLDVFFDDEFALTKCIKVGLEFDPQTNGYFQTTTYNQGFITTSTATNRSLFLIPNIIITANKKTITPYCRIGIIVSAVNNTTLNTLAYDMNVDAAAITTSTSYNNPVEGGALLAGGIDIQLFKSRDFIFGEFFLNQIIITDHSGGEPESSTGISIGMGW